MSDTLITAKDLVLERAGTKLIDHVSLRVEKAETTIIMGHNGAGKSLLIQLLHGLIAADKGEIDIAAPEAQKMVFQRPILLRRSALSHFKFTARQREMSDIESWFQKADLHPKMRVPARSLSSGEQQKLAIISALATSPSLLFLDEPTANLDRESTQEIERLITQCRAAGTSIVMISHSPQQAQRLADRILFLDKGRLADDMPAADFFNGKRSDAANRYLQET